MKPGRARPRGAAETCPSCGESRRLPILYGMPTWEAAQAAERGELVLAGCIIEPGAPIWRCSACATEWGGEDGPTLSGVAGVVRGTSPNRQERNASMPTQSAGWQPYGKALTHAMSEVLEEFPEELRGHALETADYWLSVGLSLGLERPHQARELLELIEAEEAERAELVADAAAFVEEALP